MRLLIDTYVKKKIIINNILFILFIEKPVAVKIIKNLHDINMDSVSRESHIVGWNHKNIIKIIKIKMELNISIIIMERFSGLCLQHLIDQQRISLVHCFRYAYIILYFVNFKYN